MKILFSFSPAIAFSPTKVLLRAIVLTVAGAKGALPFFFTLSLSAQPTIQWQKAFGGSLYERANSIVQTTDNGFVTTGQSESTDGDVVGNHGSMDFWVVKMDSVGIVQWQKSYGGSNIDWSYSIIQTMDQGYVVVGFTESNEGDVSGNHGDKDMWVLKLDGNGTLEWQKTLGGSGWEEAWSIEQTEDGGYIVAGRSSSNDGDVTGHHGYLDYWVVKLSTEGGIEWQKSLGGSGLDLGYSVSQTVDGGYIVTGESDSQDGDITDNHGSSDYWVVKLNFEGKVEWEKSLGGGGLDRGNDIHQTREGGYIVFGQVRSTNGDVTGNHGGYDCWAVKLNETGTIEWQKALGGSNEDYGQSIQQTFEGGYVLAGFTSSNNGDVMGNHGETDAWLLKLTEDGEIQWQRTLGGTAPERAVSIKETNDKGYIMSGEAWSNDGDVSGVHGKTDFWVVKLSRLSSPTTTPQTLPLEIFPNPATNTLSLKLLTKEPTLTLSITDLLGRELSRQTITNGGNANISALPNGLYLITATTDSGKVYSGRFRKQ